MAKDSIASVLQKPKADRGRNIFPLDNRQVYSIRAGQITPVRAQHFIPGDHFEIQTHDFSMTFPMNTAAFLRGRKETCFYSVYYSAVWSLFNQYMATRQDPKTSAFGDNPTLQEPRIQLIQLYASCYFQFFFYAAWKYYIEQFVDTDPDYQQEINVIQHSREQVLTRIKNTFDNTSITFTSTGISFSFTDITQSTTKSFSIGISYPSSYLGQGFFSFADISPRGFSRADDKISDAVYDIVGHWRVYSYVRKLDMLGYGNIYPLFKQAEEVLSQMDISGYQDWNSWISSFNNVLGKLYATLCDITSTYEGTALNPSNILPKYVNLYSICAYNSIFYHFFRNSYYDLNYQPFDYSLDFVSTSLNNQYGPYNFVSINDFTFRFLDIEYHQWKKDVFTSVFPDTQFGAVSGLQINDNSLIVPQYNVTVSNIFSSTGNATSGALSFNALQQRTGNLVGPSDTGVLSHSHLVTQKSVTPSGVNFDVIALKRAEMLQEYRQTLMRAGNRTSDIFRALYGGEPSSEHIDDIIPRFLDTFGEDIFVDPVTATASTDSQVNGTLGDLSARGKFRGDSKEFQFNAGKNFGVILCLTYLVPDAEYNSYLLDKHNLELSPEMHFLPPYENFGLEPVFSDELNCLVPANNTVNMGYSARYYHKKMALDLVHGAFCSMPQTFFSTSSEKTYGRGWFGEFNHWVSPRTDLQAQIVTRVRRFYINPSVLDNVFVRAIGPDIADDQLICNTYFVIKSTRELTKAGLINFV